MNLAGLVEAMNGDFDNASVAFTPGGIEAQEAQGQQQLVASEMLPKECRNATKEQLTALGFVFGADVDELFVSCTLPQGWKKVASDHSMHSDIVDEQGRKRAGIFYKAAFYDRRADMSLNCRFSYSAYLDSEKEGFYTAAVTDSGNPIFTSGEWDRKDYEESDNLTERCKVWINKKYPDWNNPFAYWD